MSARLEIAALALVACGSPTPSPPSSIAATPSSSLACASLPAALSSYDAITEGTPFSLTLLRDEHGAWLPAAPLAMPLHHASTIAWTDEAHLLDAQRDPQVVVVATGLGRTSIEHDEARGVWFATYAARVDRLCPVP